VIKECTARADWSLRLMSHSFCVGQQTHRHDFNYTDLGTQHVKLGYCATLQRLPGRL